MTRRLWLFSTPIRAVGGKASAEAWGRVATDKQVVRGVIAVNLPLDLAGLKRSRKSSSEVIVAPEFNAVP